jgi:hypothetical protein
VSTTQSEVSLVKIPNEGAIATDIKLPKPSVTIAPSPQPASPQVEEISIPTGPINGPTQGPTAPFPSAESGPANDVAPGSPYTSARLMIQNLTLPTIPNWNIPPSPPGSPPRTSSKKFSQFLELKKKGQHFNQRLEESSVLRDPTHLQKLMHFAGIGEEDQYVSTLPEGLGVQVKWPEWAYSDELSTSQKKLAKEKAKLPRNSVDFVSARSTTSSHVGTPSAKGSRQSAAERVMAEIDKQHATGASSQSTGKRKDLEHRGRKEPLGSRWRSRSRSPKRRRSRSRERR